MRRNHRNIAKPLELARPRQASLQALSPRTASRALPAPRRQGPRPARLRRQFPDSTFVFATERGGPFTLDSVNRLVKRIGARAGFAFPIHTHMLRHACVYALANAGHDTRRIQDWLGHRSSSTRRATRN
jgi:site-specific recombinase XerD